MQGTQVSRCSMGNEVHFLLDAPHGAEHQWGGGFEVGGLKGSPPILFPLSQSGHPSPSLPWLPGLG